MAKRVLPSALETALVNNEPFEYAHLIKFERPFNPFEGEFRENENRFVYLTDGARDIEFKGDTYNAHQLLTVGNYSETTQAKATNMNITVPGEYLGLTVNLNGTLSANNSARDLDDTCTLTATSTVVDGVPFSWTERGFKIGDKISIKKQNGTLFSGGTDAASVARDAVSEKIFIISGVSDTILTLKQTGIDSDDSSFLVSALSSPFTVGLLNEEIFGATLERGTEAFVNASVSNSNQITLQSANSKIKLGQLVSGAGVETDSVVTSITGTSLKLSTSQEFIADGTKLIFTNPSFVNRKVEVYKVFLNPETGAIFGDAVLTFKGFITSTNIQEAPNSTKVQWNMTSHWGDFSQISGRMTSDEIHRALDSNGKPQKLLAVKPQYATDLGFLHGDMSLNTIATYQTSETRYRNKTKRRGGIAGLFGGKKTYIEEYQEEVDHDVDLSVYLQGKHIPVVYGVMRVPGIPVFADTLKNDPNSIYVAYALSEGEIQGIYNLYIDSNSLLCVDAQDATARSGSDNTALTCYGRMDRGGTLGGTNINSSGTLSFEDWLDVEGLSADYDEAYNDGTEEDIEAMYDDYVAINEGNIGVVNPTDSLEGLAHEDSASISSPHDIDFTFYSGRPFQKTSNILATVAAGDNFKRQDSYYTGLERYWSPDHTLLDTAYTVAKFKIDADSTTIPEVEYVVKGKSLQCFNYDGTFVSDPVYQAATQAAYGGEADNSDNFEEGDTVSVETSYDGTTWQSETNFRILHKYTDINTRGTTQVRFILDKQPNLGVNGVTEVEVTNPGSGYTSVPTVSISGGGGSGATIVAAVRKFAGGLAGLFGKRKSVIGIENGKIKKLFIENPGSGFTSAPTISISGGGGSGATAVAKVGEYGIPLRKFVRLKSSSNKYWHMLPYNSNIQDTPLNILNSNKIDITNATTDSNGILNLTLTSAAKTRFLQLYPNTTASSDTSDAHIKIGGTLPSALKSVKDKTMRVIGLNGANLNLAVTNYRFTPNQSNLHTNLEVMPADSFFINSTHEYRSGSPHNTLTSNELIGSFFEVMQTEEIREITSVDVANNVIRLEAPLIFTPNITGTTNNNDTYVIQGKGLDKRVSINPAIQTTDLLISDRYGKGLDIEEDIDIASVRESALLCDTRSDVTVSLASAGNVTAGDIYKLTYNGNHVASGEVLTTASSTTSVTFTNVSGKFLRPFAQHIKYKQGDIILVQGASTNTPYYYQYEGSGDYETTEPSHTTNGQKVGNWRVINSISLTKVSGSGSSSLAMNVSGNGVAYSLYDGDFVKYWRYIGWINSEQFNVTRHQTNFYIDNSKPLFDNVNALLSHYNGILSYSNGKYVLSVETAESTPTASVSNGVQTNPEYIDESDILGTISLNDNSLKNAKNTIKASLNDPQNHYNSRSVSFFNADFLKSDRGIVKTGSFPFTGITSYYNARINVEKELIQSRYSKEISFSIGPKGLLLKPGEVISLTYSPFNFENKLFRIENLTYNANCTTNIKAREYDDSIYAITEQRAALAHRAVSGMGQEFAVPTKPTSLSTSNNKPGIITLNWTNGTDFKEATDSTEIWRATSQGSSGTIPNHAQLQAVVDNVTTFNDALGSAGTFYYWIRHRRNAKSTSSQAVRVVHSEFNTAITAGTTALALVPSPQLDVDISSAQIRFDDSNALTPSGTAQDVLLTATLRNITASNVTFTLVNSDTTTTASDVTFTNNNASVVDSSAPFTATIDASSFAHDTANKFVKVTCTDSNSNESFSELIPVTVSKDGSSGSIGVDAKAIKLIPSSHVVSYSAEGGESTTITFTTETQGFTGTKFYQFLVGGSVKQSSTTSTFTLADSDEPAANATTNVLVKLYDTNASGTLLAQDSVTIFGVKDGSDGVTAFLTNNSHVVSTASDGSGASFTNAGGTFKVFVGSTDITTATSGGQEVTYAVNSETGVDVSINSTSGVYTVASMSADQGSAVFRASIPANLSPDGSAFTIDQTYSISKSKTGLQGAAGSNAKTVQLTSNEYAINYDKDGDLVAGQGTGSSGSEIFTLSSDAKNFSDARFQYLENGTQIQAFTTASTETVTIPQSVFTTPKVYQVNVKEDGGSVEASDSLAVFAVQEGTDGHTVFLTNPTHAFTAATDGTVAGSELAAGATEFRVFRGSTQLTFNASGGGAGTDTYNVNGSPTLSNMTGTFSTVSNQRKFTPTAVTGDSGSATFTITAGGNTFTQTFTYSKSKKGTTGDDGVNTAEVKIYKRSSSDTAPAVPNNSTVYTFATADWPGSGNQDDGWSLTPPNTGGDFLYSCVAIAKGTGTTDTIAANLQSAGGDWSTPVRQTIEVPRSRRDTIFYSAYTRGDPQEITTSQLNALKYDFSANNFATSTLPSGWSNFRPTGFAVSYSFIVIKIQETVFEGNSETASNQTKSILDFGVFNDFLKFGREDLVLDFNDTTGLKYRFDTNDSFINVGTTPTGLKNATINIDGSGNLTGTGASNIRVSNDFIAEADLVGGSKTFSVKPNKAEFDNVSGTEGVFGFKLDGAGSFTNVDVFSSGARTQVNRLRSGKLPDSDTAVLESTAGSTSKAATAEANAKAQEAANRFTVPANATDGLFSFKIGTTGSTQTYDVLSSDSRTRFDRLRQGQNPSNASQSIVNNELNISNDGRNIRLRDASNNNISSITNLDQSLVNLSGVSNNADETSANTSADTTNVNSVASTNVTPAITAAQNNAASIIQGLSDGTQQVTANAITTGSIATSLLTLSELLLETQGTTQTGTTLSFGNYSQSHNLGTMGTGAGFYVGMVHFDNISGSQIREGSIHIDIKAGASTVYTDYMGYAFTESNGTYNQDNHYSTSERKLHMQFGFFYTGTGTLTMNAIARSTGSSSTMRVGFRSVKFGAEVVSFSGSIGNITSATAGATDQESGAITASGFTGSKTITLSGHSSGEVEVNNSGTFASSASITSGQTFKLRLDASSTAGTTRSVTATLGTASITFSVTTAGSYSSGFGSGGSGGSGSGGGGFQNNQELR